MVKIQHFLIQCNYFVNKMLEKLLPKNFHYCLFLYKVSPVSSFI